MTGRDANQGSCAQPCRYSYSLVEEKRPGEYFPVEEDERGTHILNAKDLCLLRRLPELIATGVTSLKIEGRMKGINYLASTVKVYREAMDLFFEIFTNTESKEGILSARLVVKRPLKLSEKDASTFE